MSPKHLAEDFIGPYRVSTVDLDRWGFFAIEDDYLGGKYETMVFRQDPDAAPASLTPGADNSQWMDLLCWRYRTVTEALAGHANVVKALEAGQEPGAIERERMHDDTRIRQPAGSDEHGAAGEGDDGEGGDGAERRAAVHRGAAPFDGGGV